MHSDVTSALKMKSRCQKHGQKEEVGLFGGVRASPLQVSSVSLKSGLEFGGQILNDLRVPSPAQFGWTGPRSAPATSAHLCLRRENLRDPSTQIHV